VQAALAAFDRDSDGTVTPHELAEGAKMYQAKKAQVRRLGIGLSIASALIALLVASNLGTSLVAVFLTKEARIDQGEGTMLTLDGEPVRTAPAPAEKATLWGLANMSMDELSQLETVTLAVDFTEASFSEAGSWMLASYKISSVYKDKDLSVAFLSTPDGHVIKLDGVKEKGYFFLGGWEGDEYPIAEEVPDDDDDDDEDLFAENGLYDDLVDFDGIDQGNGTMLADDMDDMSRRLSSGSAKDLCAKGRGLDGEIWRNNKMMPCRDIEKLYNKVSKVVWPRRQDWSKPSSLFFRGALRSSKAAFCSRYTSIYASTEKPNGMPIFSRNGPVAKLTLDWQNHLDKFVAPECTGSSCPRCNLLPQACANACDFEQFCATFSRRVCSKKYKDSKGQDICWNITRCGNTCPFYSATSENLTRSERSKTDKLNEKRCNRRPDCQVKVFKNKIGGEKVYGKGVANALTCNTSTTEVKTSYSHKCRDLGKGGGYYRSMLNKGKGNGFSTGWWPKKTSLQWLKKASRTL